MRAHRAPPAIRTPREPNQLLLTYGRLGLSTGTYLPYLLTGNVDIFS